MTDPQTNLIVATMKEYPLCQQIILFLIENESAMDTVKGIAACWVGCDEVAVQAALDRLLGGNLCLNVSRLSLRVIGGQPLPRIV